MKENPRGNADKLLLELDNLLEDKELIEELPSVDKIDKNRPIMEI